MFPIDLKAPVGLTHEPKTVDALEKYNGARKPSESVSRGVFFFLFLAWLDVWDRGRSCRDG